MIEKKTETQHSEPISRRAFLRVSAVAGGGAAVYASGLRPFSFETAAAPLEDLSEEFCESPAPGHKRCTFGSGATYYVDGSIGVDDEDHGTSEDRPFASIRYAVKKLKPGEASPPGHADRLKPGDTVLVKEVKDKDGNDIGYHEDFDAGNSASGSALAPVVIAAYPGHSPLIDGEAPDEGDEGGLPTGANLPKSGTLYKNRHFTYEPLVKLRGSYIIFEGFRIKGSMGRGITVVGDHVTVRRCTISHSRASGLFLQQCTGARIESCDISRSGEFFAKDRDKDIQNWPAALSIEGNRDAAILRTKVHENWGEGILVDTEADSLKHYTEVVEIRGCELYDNKAASIYLHGVNTVTVRDNLVYHSSDPEFPNPGAIVLRGTEDWAAGDKRYAVQNVDIINNIVVGCREGLGFQASPRKTKKIRMLFNTLVNGELAGIRSEPKVDFDDCHLQSNLIYQSDKKGPVKKGDFPNWTYAQNFWSAKPEGLEVDARFIGNPQLVDPDHDRPRGGVNPAWYALKDESPAAARTGALAATKALPFGGVAADYVGKRRKSNPSMGAQEYRQTPDSWSRWAWFHWWSALPLFSRLPSFRHFVVGANQDGQLELFGLTSSGSPRHALQKFIGLWGRWLPFHSSRQRFRSFTVGANRDGRLEVFGLASDNSVWHTWQKSANGAWASWQRFYQQTDRFTALHVGVNQDGRLELFGLAEDGTMWQTWQRSNLEPVDKVWSGGWDYLYGEEDKFLSLAVGSNYFQGLEVFGIKPDGTLWHTRQLLPNKPPWWGWEQFQPNSDLLWQHISVATNQDGRLEVFGVTDTGSPWHCWQREVGWSEWAPFHSLDQRFKKLFPVANADTRIEVIGMAQDNSIWHTGQTAPNTGWTEWQRLHGWYDKFIHLAVGVNQDAGLEVIGIKRNFKAKHIWQRL